MMKACFKLLLAGLVWAALSSAALAGQVVDDRGVTVRFEQAPQRIVSLLPSLTETVCALGACARLVGVDRNSDYPAQVRQLAPVGGGLDPNIEAIVALKPDLVLMMDEPLANLDPPHQADWLGVVRSLVAQGKTVVSVLHEISMALHADEMLILCAGRVTHQGACADPATHRALEAVFDHRITIHALAKQWVALPK